MFARLLGFPLLFSVVASPAAARPTCDALKGIEWADLAGAPASSWREVHGLLLPGEPVPAADAEALKAVCAEGAPCGPSAAVSLIGTYSTYGVVLQEGGKLHVFPSLFDEFSTVTPALDLPAGGQYALAAWGAESNGREEVCDEGPDGKDDPETCRTATVLMGYSFGRAVFDRRTHRLLFRAFCFQEDANSPASAGSLVVAGDAFVYTACGADAKPVTFTLADAKACAAPAAAAPAPGAAAEIKALLAAGRKATSEKRYPEALAAFDRILTLDATHARARGERGYARLAAGDLDGADADFTQAIADAGGDAKVQAAAWFNKGLVAEKRGDAAAARAAFQQAHTLRPSKATASKLGLK
ncbi:MAG: hypothetical protein R3F60_01425 [bacterium]